MHARLGSIAPACLAFDEREVLEFATRLARSLPVKLAPQLRLLSAEQSLDVEREHRVRFWRGEPEALRDTLHTEAQRMYARVEHRGRQAELSTAWTQSIRAVHSASWRERVRFLTRSGGAGYPLLFRLGQQAWTRAARWRAVMHATPESIFELTTELVARGAWPVGASDGVLHVVCPNQTGSSEPVEPSPWSAGWPSVASRWPALGERERRRVVVCAPSSAGARAAEVAGALSNAGYQVTWGVRKELGPPIERVVGAEIAAARAVVFVEFECDVDFGPPLWLRQEAEYSRLASAAQIGVGRAGASCWRSLGLPALRLCASIAQLPLAIERASAVTGASIRS